METHGKMRRSHVMQHPENRIQIHLGQIGGSSIHYPIWRSRPSSLGEPNRGGVNPDATKRRRQRPICGRRCRPSNGEQSASRASPVGRTLAPLCSPLDTPYQRTYLSVLRRHRWHVPSICVLAPGTDPGPSPMCTWTTILYRLNWTWWSVFVREFFSRGVLAQ